MSNQIGFILFDSGYAIPETPIVIMQNGGQPNGVLDYGNVRHNVIYSICPYNPNYVIAVNGLVEGVYKSKLAHLIYMGRAFCPIRHIVQKFEATRFDRYLIKRYSNGQPKAGVYFYNLYNLQHEFTKVKRSSHTTVFTVFIVSKDNNGVRQKNEYHMNYASINGTIQLNEQERRILARVCQKLKIELTELFDKLIRIQRVMTDTEFLHNLNTYNLRVKVQSPEIFILPEREPKVAKMKY